MIYPLLSQLLDLERLMGAVCSRASIPGGGPLSGQLGLCRCTTLHAQPRPTREPLPVPLTQPRLHHGPCLHCPVLHPALTGGCSLPPFNQQQLLSCPHLLFHLPPIHEQPSQRPGVQDGDRGISRQQPPNQH